MLTIKRGCKWRDRDGNSWAGRASVFCDGDRSGDLRYSDVRSIVSVGPTSRLGPGGPMPVGGCLGQFDFGYGLELHVAGAFVDLADFAIAEEFFDWVFFCEAVAAEEVDGQRADFFGILGRH